MSSDMKTSPCSAHAGVTKTRGLSGFQIVLFLCAGALAMEAVSRIDNSSWISTNARVLRPAYELVAGAPATDLDDVGVASIQRRSPAGAL